MFLAHVLWRLGETREAGAWYAKAVERAPENEDFVRWQAQFLRSEDGD